MQQFPPPEGMLAVVAFCSNSLPFLLSGPDPRIVTLTAAPQNDQAGNPTSSPVFASFVAFCLNSLPFLLSGPDPRNVMLAAEPQNDQAGNPTPSPSLLPLLPSVQILFRSFCQGRTRGMSRSQRDLRMIRPETRPLVRLCFLCCLLFKFSSVSPVRAGPADCHAHNGTSE